MQQENVGALEAPFPLDHQIGVSTLLVSVAKQFVAVNLRKVPTARRKLLLAWPKSAVTEPQHSFFPLPLSLVVNKSPSSFSLSQQLSSRHILPKLVHLSHPVSHEQESSEEKTNRIQNGGRNDEMMTTVVSHRQRMQRPLNNARNTTET